MRTICHTRKILVWTAPTYAHVKTIKTIQDYHQLTYSTLAKPLVSIKSTVFKSQKLELIIHQHDTYEVNIQ